MWAVLREARCRSQRRVQTLTCTAVSGTFALTLGWAATAVLSVSTSSSSLAAALTRLPTAGGTVLVSIANGVAVCGAQGPVTTIEFTSTAVASPPLAATTSPTPGLMSVATVHAVGALACLNGTWDAVALAVSC